MRYELYAVRTGKGLGEVLVFGGAVQYGNAAVRAVLEPVVRRAGVRAVPGWTNGYAAVRRA